MGVRIPTLSTKPYQNSTCAIFFHYIQQKADLFWGDGAVLRGLQARGKTFIFHFAVNFPFKPWRHLIAADNVHYLHQAFSLLELSSV